MHFLLKLYFSLPEEDLPLSLYDFSQNVCLFLLKCGDLVLQFYAFILQFLELLLELILNIEVIICELCLLGCVFIVKVVQLVHLEVKILKGNLEVTNLFIMALH